MKSAVTKPTSRDEIPDVSKLRVSRRGPLGKRVSLRTVREAAGKTQAGVAAALGCSQAEVSRVEARSDVLVSTLRAYARAVGAECEVVFVLPKTGHRLRIALGDERPSETRAKG